MQQNHLEIILEDINKKFDLVLEGHSYLGNEIKRTREDLTERIDLLDGKINVLNNKIGAVDKRLSEKIDAVAADLRAHRADTEAHKGLYLVKEE